MTTPTPTQPAAVPAYPKQEPLGDEFQHVLDEHRFDLYASDSQAEQTGSAVPRMTPEEINALPEQARDYIHQLETNADPAGMVRENMQLRDTNEGLQRMYRKAADALAAAAPMSAQPSDADIKALAYQHLQAHARTEGGVWYEGEVAFARAILARWGAPAPTTEQAAECSREEYRNNILEGVALWLYGRSKTVWAKEFGHTSLMQRWAADLRKIALDLRAAPGGEAPAEDARDAARYRWLREQGTLTDGFRHPHSWRCVAMLADMGGEHADAAIDAAMAAQSQKGAA